MSRAEAGRHDAELFNPDPNPDSKVSRAAGEAGRHEAALFDLNAARPARDAWAAETDAAVKPRSLTGASEPP